MSPERPPVGKPKPTRARVVFDWVAGLTLIGVGIVGLFVPVLQGLALIVAGLAVLSSHSRWARALLDRLKGAGRKMRDSLRQRREAHRARRHPEDAAPGSGERDRPPPDR